jgi:hypothetical protein
MPEAFIPYTVTGASERGILVRTSTPPSSMIDAVKREIWAVDRNVAVTFVGTLTESLRQYSYAEPRLALVILGVFACLGLILVALGVFSVIAYTVSRQTHEIGIRMALGAARGDVLWMILGLGVKLIGAGVAVGIGASLGLTRVLEPAIRRGPHDPPPSSPSSESWRRRASSRVTCLPAAPRASIPWWPSGTSDGPEPFRRPLR